MKKCKLIFTVVTVLLLSLVMALTASAADAPTRESAEEIFYDMGFSTWGNGYFGWSLSEPEADDVPDEVAFQYMYLSGALNDYYDDETGYYTIAYDEYIALVDKTFVNHSDMKAYLADMTDPETDVVSWFRGGFGGPETWVPTEYCVKGDYCYVTGVFADRAIEDYPDFVEMEYGKETINDGDYQAVILHDIILTLQNTEDGWKILEYRENSYHVVDDLLYSFDEEMMYRFTFEDNGNVSVEVSEKTQEYFTGFYGNDSLWHPEISTHSYEIVADENYEIESVVLTDANGETVIEPDEDGVYTFEAVGVGSLKVTTKGIPAIKEYEGGLAYYIGNDIATDYTGLVVYDGVAYYVENGFVNYEYVGLCEYYGSYFYVNNGVVDWSYIGLCYYGDSWFYVNGGVLDWSYTGLCYYGDSWFYIGGGVLDWSYTGLCPYGDAWFYINGGVLDWSYTGLCQYGDAWFYIKGGVLDWSYTGLCYYGESWFYINNGVFDADYVGLVYFGYSWIYIYNGHPVPHYEGLCYHEGDWYYVKHGSFDSSYTGLYQYNGGWFYLKNGVIDWGYTGLCGYNGVTYYVENGVLTHITGLYADDHTRKVYFINEGAVDRSFTGFVEMEGYWLFIEEGLWDYTFTGTVELEDGSVAYIEEGVVVDVR